VETWKVTGSGTLIVDGVKLGAIDFELFRRTSAAHSGKWSGHGKTDPSTLLKALRGNDIIVETASAAFLIFTTGHDLSNGLLVFNVVNF